jgi:hypothetical protein
MPIVRNLLVALLCISAFGPSRALVLPDGLAIDPPESIDVTQQLVPSVNQQKQVLAVWDGDTLRYLITVEKLPVDAPQSQAYFYQLVADLRAAGTIVDTGKRGEYQSTSGWRGNYLVLKSHAKTQTRVDLTVAHYVTDGKVAFVAFARQIGATPAEQLVDETVSLFQTAHLGIPELSAPAPISAGKP